MKPKGLGKVVVLEDDGYLAQTICSEIADLGGDCESFGSVARAERCFAGPAPNYLIADVAVPLGASKLITEKQARAGFHSGIAFTRIAKKRWKHTKFVLVTGQPDQEVSDWCGENGVIYRVKPVDRVFLEQIFSLRPKRAFVVHGRNLQDVKFIKRVLRFCNVEPIVLFEQPSKGRTVIEKFEEVSAGCDLAVVALSGDDLGKLHSSTETQKLRARQNVIFELGYFYGTLRRSAGRVILVDFGIDDVPSDLAGIVRIDGRVTFKNFCQEFGAELS